MDATRDVAVKLMKESKVQIEQHGEVLRGIQSAKELKGRIRLRLVKEKKMMWRMKKAMRRNPRR